MTTSQNMTFRHALFILVVFTSAACFGADIKKSLPEDFLGSVYRFHQPWTEQRGWWDNKQTLSKYFDKELTALFLKDAECQKREQGVCNLTNTPGGWRISDIKYAEGPSLKETLSHEIK